MKTPEWDPDFPAHPRHGAQAQARMVSAVMPFVKQRRVAVDVGAHIGLWSVQLASLFDLVLAFEPVPENFACLTENAPQQNVRKMRLALGAHHGDAAMRRAPETNSGCWYAGEGRGVRVAPLDCFGLASVDLIKIDVEGNEGQVLLGAQRTIERSAPAIMFEDNGAGPRYFGKKWVDPKPVLLSYGYVRAKRVFKDEIWVKEKTCD